MRGTQPRKEEVCEVSGGHTFGCRDPTVVPEWDRTPTTKDEWPLDVHNLTLFRGDFNTRNHPNKTL